MKTSKMGEVLSDKVMGQRGVVMWYPECSPIASRGIQSAHSVENIKNPKLQSQDVSQTGEE